MTNAPKPVYRARIWEVYETRCAARLADSFSEEPLDGKKYTPEETKLSGFVEWKFVRRVSSDGACILLADIFIDEYGKEHLSIVVLEIDGEELYGVYDEPQSLGDEL